MLILGIFWYPLDDSVCDLVPHLSHWARLLIFTLPFSLYLSRPWGSRLLVYFVTTSNNFSLPFVLIHFLIWMSCEAA